MLQKLVSKLYSAFIVFMVSLVCVGTWVSCSVKDTLSDEPIMNPTGGLKSVWPKPDDKLAVGNELKSIYFDTDSTNIRSTEHGTLKFNAEWLKNHPETVVQVEGHCDERGSNAYNLTLGEERAAAAKSFLERLGVDPSRIEVVSYGRVPGAPAEIMAKNRRVQFFVIYTK